MTDPPVRAELRGRRIAEVLYDELTGRGGEDEDNAVLAHVVSNARDDRTERDRRVHELLLEAQYLGYEVHRPSGDRWGLALRLADRVLTAIDSEPRRKWWHRGR